MDNPIYKPRTGNFLQDIEDLARDLAYGVSVGHWNSSFTIDYFDRRHVFGWAQISSEKTNLRTLFYEKWALTEDAPDYDALCAYGFMEMSLISIAKFDVVSDSRLYSLTRKAFDLLQKPSQAPSIFISYRRRESSTFALLVEARLRMAGADPKRIFIDKTIPIGDEWESHLVERLTSCEVFICLVGKTAFEDGSWLQREIEILQSENPNALVMPILHNDVTPDDILVKRYFGSRQNAVVKEESALEYENAINHILNRLGYETYWPSPTSPFSGLGTN